MRSIAPKRGKQLWSLEAPQNLLWFLALPVLVYLVHFRKDRGGQLRFSVELWGGESFSGNRGALGALYVTSRVLFWIGIGLLVVASAGPTTIVKERVFLSEGADIMIVIDESPSMSAQDFRPVNRFESARQVVRKFVEERDNDQIGLVSFGTEAALRVPLTPDHSALLEALDLLWIMELGDDTAIGMGIAVAAAHLRASRADEKVIIVLTDGDNNAGELVPETAAEIAYGLGIKVHTIGIGKEGDTYLEFRDPKTGKILRGPYRGRLNESLLKRIASVSGGRYFYAGSPGTLRAIFDEIGSAQRREVKERWEVNRLPKYHVFLLVGLILLVCDFVIRKGALQELL